MFKKIILCSCLSYSIFSFASAKAEVGNDVNDLKLQIEKLEKRVQNMEQTPPKNKANNYFNNLDFKIGGYIKADMIYDLNGESGDYIFLPTIPINKSDETGDKFRIHARESRFNITVKQPSDYGEMKAFLEVDFYGTNGSETVNNNDGLRLRQAYGKIGNFLFGQTWTNFVDLTAIPEVLDFGYPEGMNATRQTQFRYTIYKNNLLFAMSIENPESDFIDSNQQSGSTTNEKSDNFPDLTLRSKINFSKGHISLSGLYRQISADNGIYEDSKSAYGIALSGKMKTFKDDNLKFRVAYGDGIGRYIRDAYNHSASLNQADYTLKLQKAVGGYIGYEHFWTKSVRSNLVYGFTYIDNNIDVISDEQNKQMYSIHANLLWSLNDKWSCGAEYIFGKREFDNNNSGIISRMQTSIKLKF